MSTSLKVTFVSRDRTVWTGSASSMVVPASDGSLGILPGMIPTLSLLGSGTVTIQAGGGQTRSMSVDGGFMSVDSDVVTLVVDGVTFGDEQHRSRISD